VEKDRTRKHFSCLASQLEEYGFSRSPIMKIRHSFVCSARKSRGFEKRED
jgi:hypothetical protein